MARWIMMGALLGAGVLAGAAGSDLWTAVPQEEVKPGPEHKLLRQEVGRWAATLKVINAVTGEEVVSKGQEINKMGPGGFTLLQEFKGKIMDAPFNGRGMVGYNDDGKLVAAWADDNSGKLRFLTGSYSDDGKTRVLLGESKHQGELYKERHTLVMESKSRRSFMIETQGSDQKWLKALVVEYKKR